MDIRIIDFQYRFLHDILVNNYWPSQIAIYCHLFEEMLFICFGIMFMHQYYGMTWKGT